MSYYEPEDDYPAIVIDNGSSTCRAGFAGDDAPRSVFPSIVGRRKHQLGDEKTYIGDEAQSRRELLSLSYPMEHGIVTNWDDMEKIWNHAFFTDLKTSPDAHPVLISEPPLNPKGNREKMAQVMFESYRTPAFFLAYQPMLSLLSSGLHHGMMVSMGDSVTHVVPIYETQAMFQAARRLDFGGRDLTRYLQHLLYQSGHSFTTSSELEIVREIKEELCFVAEDVSDPAGLSLQETYKLPDGSSIKLSKERHQCPEIIFRPDGVFNQGKSIAELIMDSVSDLPFEARKEMLWMTVVSGGTSLFPGFPERLKQEMMSVKSFNGDRRVKIWAGPERKYHEWIGGSILASLTTFHTAWITREEYNEQGPHIVIFEGYRSPCFYVANEANLVLYSAGNCSGTMVTVGDGVTHVVPIYEGYALSHAVRRSDFGGRDLTLYLQHLLHARGYSFTTSAELDIVREVKEQMCFLSTKKTLAQTLSAQNLEEQASFEEKSKRLQKQSYQLPDGSYIKLGEERHQCPEILFQPDKTFNKNKSITELVHDSLNACDIYTRADLFAFVVLSGGSTFFPDFASRLHTELAPLIPKRMRIVARPERKYHAWIGGSLLASLTSFQQMWVTRQEYDEYGPDILHRKCFT